MLASLARKTFDIYTAPARFVCRQTQRNLAYLLQLRGDYQQRRAAADQALEPLLDLIAGRLGIDTTTLTGAARQREIHNALVNARYGLTLALRESLKAAVLRALRDRDGRRRRDSEVIDGECQHIG